MDVWWAFWSISSLVKKMVEELAVVISSKATSGTTMEYRCPKKVETRYWQTPTEMSPINRMLSTETLGHFSVSEVLTHSHQEFKRKRVGQLNHLSSNEKRSEQKSKGPCIDKYMNPKAHVGPNTIIKHLQNEEPTFQADAKFPLGFQN